jgi:quinone-modifying oxidoreductase subunit QmoC
MAEACLLKPDAEFIDELVASGGGDLKKCFQCATCSVVCELSSGPAPFPRKEMIWAQWGLKDRLVADPDIWRCYQCNDCSTRCPRGARPGDVLAAVRAQAIRHYAIPQFMSDWVNQPRFLPLLLVVPAILLGLALLLRGPIEQAMHFEPPRGFYAQFVPHWLLIGFFSLFVGLAVVLALAGVVRFWGNMRRADTSQGGAGEVRTLLGSVGRTVASIFRHDRFGKCTNRASRRTVHLLAFYGFLALFATTVWAVMDLYVNPRLLGIASLYPFDMTHPIKILANVGAVVLIVGCVKALWDRTGQRAGDAVSTSFDWIFVWWLLGVGVTGAVIEVVRLAVELVGSSGLETTAYTIYFIHLVLVFGLLVYLPYSKFAHIVYRTAALVYAERTGREDDTRRLLSAPRARQLAATGGSGAEDGETG